MTGDSRTPDEPEASEGPADPAASGLRGRVSGTVARVSGHVERATERATAWTERQEATSRKGVALAWFERYRAADGQLYALLLAAYLFVTLLPAALAMATYASRDPAAIANNLVDRLDLHGATATLVREVLSGASGHQLTATLIAVASVVTFGLGIGRTLQLVYGRVWGIPPQRNALSDSVRYFVWLLVFLLGSLLYVIEESLLKGAAGWVEWAIAPLWVLATIALFAWSPVYLLHGRVTVRHTIPGAVLTTVGLIGLRILSSYQLANWLNWYSKYYGGIGIVMAIFFWLVLGTTILVVCAALSPAYAVRRGIPPPSGDGPVGSGE